MRSDIFNNAVYPTTDVACLASMGFFGDKLTHQYCFGYNPDLDTGSIEDIWNYGGEYLFFPSTAVAIEVLSASSNDTSTGVGARTLSVVGLDAEGIYKVANVILDGTNAVAVSGTWLRVFAASVITAGSSAANVGAITVRQVSAGTICCYINIGDNHSQQAIFTTPIDYCCTLEGGHACVGKSSDAIISLQVRRKNSVWQTAIVHHIYEGQISLDSCVIANIKPLSDIRIRASTTSNNIGISADFHMLLHKMS